MIRGGDHVEWPRDYFYDTAYDKEAEMEMNREYEEAVWGQILKDGPPKDDDIKWVKKAVWKKTVEGGIPPNASPSEKDKLFVAILEDL